ncbi:MAG TPA: hypothetical protein VFR44_04310 [Actinomycetota bacterium]|nr:hypothetical protein [Actinomycetota bacterium]
MIGQDMMLNAEGLEWILLAILAFMVGVLTGLIGLVSMAIRGYRAPVAGAIVTICGVVFILSIVAFGIVDGEIPGGPWPLLGGLGIAIGLCMAFLGNRPPDRQPLPRMCGESAPRGRPCALPPGHEGSHRSCDGSSPRGRPCGLPPGHGGSHWYLAPTRHHPPSKERAASQHP